MTARSMQSMSSTVSTLQAQLLQQQLVPVAHGDMFFC
jgi:isopentenyl phosphate kinase